MSERSGLRSLGIAVALALVAVSAAAATGDVERGTEVFRACAACHSLVPARHRTGPSLAGIIGRKAGTAEGFRRYSPALKAADVVWDEASLDDWIADPSALVPGNRMIFQGLPDAQARADLIAFLVQADRAGATAQQSGMMADGDLPDLKALGPQSRVTAISYCDDTYEVITADGGMVPFWEFNLRFKTDGSDRGPEPGKPAIVGTGMAGDRAAVVFAKPQEISSFIASGC